MTDVPNEADIFLAAIEIGDPELRAAYLDAACGEDDQLRQRIEALLRQHAEAEGVLDAPPSALAMTAEVGPISERPGTVIGPYRLLQQIGEGGMGVVFMAEQAEPVKRTVALKIIKPGMDTRHVIARFEAERQAVAMMDHPNIAKVLDAGATESGRPYFVMELVKGVPITKYCDEKHLPLRARLELFTQVCQAVQHAHQKGIIHRDLKPNNVLVAEYDNRAVPKVIDFGVAKATAHRLTERTMFTEFGQVLGTMEYMSPEQAKLNQLDVDTRSDVYSLGVLLYELLTGSTPFEGKRLHEAAFDEMLRIIREEEPQKPSTRLSTMDQLPNVAANRGLEPNKLGGFVKGELDWIVMKALEKDRNRRYESASAFAADIERHLHDESVEAGPPSATYRFRKFARRNRLALLTGSLVSAALLLGTIVSTWQAIRAEKARSAETAQREVAERQRVEAQKQRGLAEANLQKARQAVDEYFTLVSESKLLDVPGMQPLRKELLEAALRYYQTMLDEQADDPAVLSDLAMAHLRTANVYHELGRVNDALVAVDTALQHVERLRQDYPDAIEHQRRLAGFWNVLRHFSSTNETIKDLTAGHRTLTKFLKVWETLASENPSVEAFQNDVASINLLLSLLEGTRGGAGEAAAFTRAAAYSNKAIAIWEQLSQMHPELPNHRENLAFVYSALSYALGRSGQQDQARQAAARSAALRETLIAESPNLPTYRELAAERLSSVAAGLAQTQPQEAEAAYRRAVQAWQKLATDFPAAPQYAIELSREQGKLVELLAGPLKRPDEASRMSRALVEQLAKLAVESPESPILRREVALTRGALAQRLRVSKENWSDAEKLHLESLADFNKLSAEFPEEPQHVEQAGHSYRYLGWIARDLGRLDAAADYFEHGVAAFQKLAEGKAPSKYEFYRDYKADSLIELALVLAASNNLEAAETAARQAAEIYELLVRDHAGSADYRQKAARALRVLSTQSAQQDKLAEALIAAQKSARLAPNDFYAHGQLHHVLARMGDPEQTLVVLRENIAAMPDSPMAHHYLGVALEQQGRHEEAIAKFRRTLELYPTWGWPHLCMASNYAALGQWDEAAVEYARTFKMDAGSWRKVVDSLKAKGQPAESEKVLRRLLAIADQRADDAQGRYVRGALHRELGDLDKAIADASWVNAKDPNMVEAWDLRGQCYLAIDEFAKAEADFSAGIELDPGQAKLWTGRASSHFHQQQWEDAVADYTEAIRLDPKAHTNWYHRGLAYMQLAQWERAAADFSKVIVGWPDEPGGWYLRGLARAQLNQPDSALADLRQAIARGYNDVEQMRTERKLDPLRSNPEFKKLLAELENQIK